MVPPYDIVLTFGVDATDVLCIIAAQELALIKEIIMGKREYVTVTKS